MDIEKAKEYLYDLEYGLKLEQEENIKKCGYNPEQEIEAIETVLNELDKDNNIISDLQNEVTLKQCELDKKDKIINELLLLQKPSRKRKNRTMNYIKINKANKFGVNGVCQDMRALKRTGEIKYRAYITLFGKQYTLGTHDTLESAIQARKNGEEKVKNILKNLKYKESED